MHMAIYVNILGIDSSTDLDDRYSNLFLNAYIYSHAHTEYLKMIEVILVTIATGKSKINARHLHLGYSSNKLIR